MDYYIVRIYRRSEDQPQTFTGLVETVGLDGTQVFNNEKELWKILSLSRNSPGKGRRKEKSTKTTSKILRY